MPTTTDSPRTSDVDNTDEVVYVPTNSPPAASQLLLMDSAADVYAALEIILAAKCARLRKGLRLVTDSSAPVPRSRSPRC